MDGFTAWDAVGLNKIVAHNLNVVDVEIDRNRLALWIGSYVCADGEPVKDAIVRRAIKLKS